MSYVALDLDKMQVLFKAPDIRSACLISALEYEEVAHCIFPVERDGAYYHTENKANRKVRLPGFLTRMEQTLLYRHMTGTESEPKIFGDLMAELHKLLCELPENVPSLWELERKAGAEPLAADIGMPDPEALKQILPVSIPSAPPTAPAFAIPSAPKIPSAPGIPKAPSAIPSAPKAGGTTARVWDICNSQAGMVDLSKLDMKAFRKSVVDACEAEGINPGTAGTQFAAWKRSKGF